MADDPGRHAVVLGGSVAGLLAARVLAETFDRVTIVERDAGPVEGFRRGAPQGRHLHGLLEGGRRILEELYPGLTAELAADGAPTTEVLVGSRWYFAGRRAYPQPTGLTSVLAARPLLETVLRARTVAGPGIRLLTGATAT
ncbi:MAG: FAD-dependent oxidoreductase, partial [Frankia sp.]